MDEGPPTSDLAELIGDSAVIREVRAVLASLVQQLTRAVRLPPLLFLGETGTGKGLAARAVHRAGPRAAGPFVAVNCAAVPPELFEAELFGVQPGAFTDARAARPGLFRSAHGGTLFLDEVGALPLPLQAKLLTVIDSREVRPLGGTQAEPADVWLMAATNEDLATARRDGRFREDLYHRLATVSVCLPPLRERGFDILALAEHYLALAVADYGLPARALTADARAALLAHSWPGNVRELANVIERAALLTDGGRIGALDLDLPVDGGSSADPASPSGLRDAVADLERARLQEALEATGWNLSRAARRLGLPRNTLRFRISRLGLVPSAAVPRAAATAAPSRPRPVILLYVTAAAPHSGGLPAVPARPLDALVAKAHAFGGQVLERNAAGFLAAFGVEPDEDAPSRAAHAALAIRTAARRTAVEDPALPPIRLVLHAATLPIDQDATATLEGLCAEYDPCDIVVSDAVAPHLQRRFSLAPLDPT